MSGGKALKQMLSVRFDPPVLHATRLYAESKGITVSDVVRAALLDYLAENAEPEQWFTFPFTGHERSRNDTEASFSADGTMHCRLIAERGAS